MINTTVLCKKITNGQASGIISFGIKGGIKAGTKFIDALQMILRLSEYWGCQVTCMSPSLYNS